MQTSAFDCLRAAFLSAAAGVTLSWSAALCAAAPDPSAQTLPPSAPAAAPRPPMSVGPADSGWTSDAAAQLTHLEEETMLLKAQIKKLDA
ncbi:MAG TPA: hypothetical protein VEN30_30785, partial [Paraburkholderia sp.]|nr:hypothetical protein [Paraburkholderia sp.]